MEMYSRTRGDLFGWLNDPSRVGISIPPCKDHEDESKFKKSFWQPQGRIWAKSLMHLDLDFKTQLVASKLLWAIFSVTRLGDFKSSWQQNYLQKVGKTLCASFWAILKNVPFKWLLFEKFRHFVFPLTMITELRNKKYATALPNK